jgi:hypothetical protein
MTNNIWKNFYDNIKDHTWPMCDSVDDFVNLPANIQLEILNLHLLQKPNAELKIVKENTDDDNQPVFLYELEKIKDTIGAGDCLLDMRDAIFLYSVVYSKKPKYVLEIGRFRGWSTAIISSALKDTGTGTVFSVDCIQRVHPEIDKFLNQNTVYFDISSKELLDNTLISNTRFDIVFIDGDHSYNMVLNDLEKTSAVSTDQCYFLIHDSDIQDVETGVDDFLKSNDNFVDCGILGTKIRMIKKSLRKR